MSIVLSEPRFSKIPSFTRDSAYRVDVGWGYLEKNLEDWSRDYGLELEPDFQRAHVWTREKQVAYVEFVLRGGKSSNQIYFNSPAFGSQRKKASLPDTIVLVDGLQRLTAVRAFMNDEFKVFGWSHSEFKDGLDICRHRFSVNVNDLGTRAEVLQWYLDLNAGGVAHTNDEIERVRQLLEAEQ
jgi:hypothetical protein